MSKPFRRLAPLSHVGTLTLKKTNLARDHDTALLQVMERVGMEIDNAKFAFRDWVHIDWASLHWSRPGELNERQQVQPSVKDGVCNLLTARGFSTAELMDPRRGVHQLIVSWGNKHRHIA